MALRKATYTMLIAMLVIASLFVFSGCSMLVAVVPEQGQEVTGEFKETAEIELIPMVMIKGEMYYYEGKNDLGEGRCGVMDIAIDDTVSANDVPTKDNQSNFGKHEGQITGDGEYEFLVNNEWWIFKKNTDEWGIKLIPSHVTNASMTLTAVQSGGNYTGELNTGSYFAIEKKTDSGWEALGPVAKDVAWDALAYMINLNDSTSWEIDWSFLYGELESGSYRICKEVMDFRKPGDYDEKLYYAEFDIK